MKTNKEQNNKKKGDLKREVAEYYRINVGVMIMTILTVVSMVFSWIFGTTTKAGEVCSNLAMLFGLVLVDLWSTMKAWEIKKFGDDGKKIIEKFEEELANQRKKLTDEMKKEMKRKMIAERARISNQAEDEHNKKNKLRLEILSRLSMREMTGEDAYRIMQELFSQKLDELEATLSDLMSGEEEMRDKVFKRLCEKMLLSDEGKNQIAEFLQGLNVSGLEIVEDVISKEETVEAEIEETPETENEGIPEVEGEETPEEATEDEPRGSDGMDQITVGDESFQFGYPDEEAQSRVKDADVPATNPKNDMHEVVLPKDHGVIVMGSKSK